jgi:head-tail adaptor
MTVPVLGHALILETPEQVGDGAGGFHQVWAAVGTHWAEITVRSGRETATSGTAISRVTCKIVVRGAPWGSPERPKPQQRFRHGTRVFTIEAVAERDPEGRYLTCFAQEELAI